MKRMEMEFNLQTIMFQVLPGTTTSSGARVADYHVTDKLVNCMEDLFSRFGFTLEEFAGLVLSFFTLVFVYLIV